MYRQVDNSLLFRFKFIKVSAHQNLPNQNDSYREKLKAVHFMPHSVCTSLAQLNT